jgi:protein transport protein SEC24
MVMPVTQSVSDYMETVDIDCTVNLVAKQAAEVALKTGLDNSRQRAHQLTIDILRASKQSLSRGAAPVMAGQPEHVPPASLQLLPLYAMALQKSLALRGGTDVRVDERAFYIQLLLNMPIEESRVFIYPRMFSIHDMEGTPEVGVPTDNSDEGALLAGPDNIRLPPILNLSHERTTSDGMYLMENGQDMFIWIGRSVNPALLNTLFGLDSLEGVDMAGCEIQANSDFSTRVAAVIAALRSDRTRYMQLHYIKEGDGYAEAFFSRYLIEDRAAFQGGAVSYAEYHAYVNRQVQGLH